MNSEHCMCQACRGGTIHASDCAVHNAPAFPVGDCDCGAEEPFNMDLFSVLFEVERAIEHGSCPWQIEAAFEAYQAAQRLKKPTHKAKEQK